MRQIKSDLKNNKRDRQTIVGCLVGQSFNDLNCYTNLREGNLKGQTIYDLVGACSDNT